MRARWSIVVRDKRTSTNRCVRFIATELEAEQRLGRETARESGMPGRFSASLYRGDETRAHLNWKG